MSSLGVALVTGASKGIGRAIALRLAKDGFDVGINDIPAARKGLESLRAQITEKGRNSTIAVGDVSMPPNVENMISTVVKDLGRLDVMVANAGICRAHLITETEVEEWEKLFAVNARGVFLCYKYAALQMIKQGQGEASLGAYSATKFAVRGLTQAAATEWGRHGITVNAYCPGIIQTDIIQDIADGTKMLLDDVYTKFGAQSAVGRNGTVEDVANVVSFLASKDARLITGTVKVAVDGGMQYS
ncbi:putative secondary metabolism biosynthetic enzyme [Termitomyces sp. Mn162]|nr:putative secondary metabolism biosynthetic enzyme [Termitomyces sp. Mn162]